MEREEQVSKNIELAGLFLDHLLEHPSELEEAPHTANVVLLTEEDEELSEANMQMARRLARKCPNCGNPLQTVSDETDEPPDRTTGVMLREVCS